MAKLPANDLGPKDHPAADRGTNYTDDSIQDP